MNRPRTSRKSSEQGKAVTKQEVIRYWVESPDMDSAAMESLFSNGHHVWALFVGHLVVEKIIKALYVKRVGVEVPRSHNLLAIAERAGLELDFGQKMLMDEITGFNIRARYPDVKRRFLKKANRAFTEERLTKIRELRIWLLEQIRS